MWIPAHCDIIGETEADRLARISSSLPMGIRVRPFLNDLRRLIDQDMRAWSVNDWPFFSTARLGQIDFQKIN